MLRTDATAPALVGSAVHVAGPGGAGHDRGHVLVIVENVALGIDQRLRKQVPALLAAGYHVSVVTRRDPANEAYRSLPGLTLLEHPAPSEPRRAVGYLWEYLTAFWWAAALSAAVRARARVDVVQFCQPPDIYIPLAGLLRRSGAAVVVDQRDLMPELMAARYGGRRPVVHAVLRRLERWTQRVADHGIGVNEYLRTRMVQAGARPDRVAVVRNGPQLERVDAARPDGTLRAGAQFLCCWEGKMGRQDRVDLLVDVVAELVHERGRHDCRFVLLGDGECLEELRLDVARRGLDPWVALPGWLTEPELYRHLASADLGLDTSLQVEVSPVKAMEYMAFGLPVVAFDLPETAVVVADAGVLVPPRDIGAFANAVEALLDDRARRAALGAAGRERIVDELCWERQATTYLSVIHRAAGRCAGPARPVAPSKPTTSRHGSGART